MQEIWLLFKAIEVVMGIVCVVMHVLGFLYHMEPVAHNLIYCSTFLGFVLVSLLGAFTIALGSNTTPLMEAVTCICAAVAHFIASLVSMYDTEHDVHLMYLTDIEETEHPYFKHCTRQSISALVTAAFYMMHGMLALDAICLTANTVRIPEQFDELDDIAPRKPIRMFMGGAVIHRKLEARFIWFRRLANR